MCPYVLGTLSQIPDLEFFSAWGPIQMLISDWCISSGDHSLSETGYNKLNYQSLVISDQY